VQTDSASCIAAINKAKVENNINYSGAFAIVKNTINYSGAFLL
jgi:hypothetical protein